MLTVVRRVLLALAVVAATGAVLLLLFDVQAPAMKTVRQMRPFDRALYRRVSSELRAQASLVELDELLERLLETGRTEVLTALVRMATDPGTQQDRRDLLSRRTGSLPEPDLLAAVEALLDNEHEIPSPHRRMLAAVVSGHATRDEAVLAEDLLIQLGTPPAEVRARLEEIRSISSHVRAYRSMYRVDPGTTRGIQDLERIIRDESTDPRVHHEAMQKAILAPPAPRTYALHRAILAGAHRRGTDTSGSDDAYQVRLMRVYEAQSREEALRAIDAKAATD